MRDRAIHTRIVPAPNRHESWMNRAQQIGDALFEKLWIKLLAQPGFDISIEWVTNH